MRRPLWWLVPGVLFTALFGSMAWRDERDDRAFRDRTTVVTATIDAGWPGGSLVPVTYADPADGTTRRAVVAWGTYPPEPGDRTVEIRAGTGPDAEVGPQPYGDQERWPLLLQFAVPCVGGSAIWSLARRHRRRRSRALIASDEPAYRMLAVPFPGRVFGRRWRLALHEVDARPGDRAVCVVPVVGQPLRDGVRPVEVKGRPRPGGEVVVREEGGRLWWPAGRAMVGARSHLRGGGDVDRSLLTERGRVPSGAWVLLGVAGALLVGSMAVSDDPGAAAERSVPSTATVVVGRSSPGPVTVEHEWEGAQRTVQVVVDGPVATGAAVPIRVDPDAPQRVWVEGEEVPELDDPAWAVFLFVASVPLLLVALAATRRPLTSLRDRVDDAVSDRGRGGGFDLVDGTLWYRGPSSPSPLAGVVRRARAWGRGPALGFEPRGLVVATDDVVDVWPWERHVGRDDGPGRWYAASDGDVLSLVAPHVVVEVPGADGASVVDLIEAVVRVPGVQQRLADRAVLEDLLAALAAEGPARGPAGPTILGDG